MTIETAGDARAVLVTRCEDIRRQVLAAAAAAAVDLRVCADATELGAGQPPGLVLVGADQVPLVARSPVLSRAAVHLVGGLGDQERLCEWSAALDATVIVLPDGLRWLTAVLAGGSEQRAGVVLALTGGSGGIGTSTFAAGLAWAATRRGVRAALVDLDPGGGGADLLVGLEDEPGWRWPALAGADGFLGDLHPHLPGADSLAVLSHDRARPVALTATAVLAVLKSLARSHALVVMDAGARPASAALDAVRFADGALLVCAGDYRGVAAAADRLRTLDAQVPLGLLLSRVRGGGYRATDVARALGQAVLAQIPNDRRVAAAADHGQPPGRVAGRGWRRTCAKVLDGLLPQVAP